MRFEVYERFSDQHEIELCEKGKQIYYYRVEKLLFRNPRNLAPSTSALEMMI